jgi:CRP/FNR family transcriptional regulator
MLSNIDRIIFLKEVPFFQSMTIDQLKVLAAVCEEKFYEKGKGIFQKGDTGGVLYIVVNGRVGIEYEKRTGSFARLADMNAYSYFGEANFFDNNQHSMAAMAIRDTLILQLRREPLIELARNNPNLALGLINVLSQRLREDSEKVADLTRSQPRKLNKLYDKFD